MKSWCIGKPSARFVAKMEDVLEVYQRPYDPKRPVVCLDEKSKEMHSSPRETLPASPARGDKPATATRQDYEYARNGTRNLFLWVEPLAGRRHVCVTEHRKSPDFAQQLRALADEHYSQAEKIVLVTDNLNTHSPACLYESFAPEEAWRIARKFEWHYTPEHGSWLNMAEIELSVSSCPCWSVSVCVGAFLIRRRWNRRRRPGSAGAIRRSRLFVGSSRRRTHGSSCDGSTHRQNRTYKV